MRTKIFGACALAALALAACSQQNADQSASQPLAPPDPAETAPAPAASALPPAPPARVRYAPPERRYTALNDAYAMGQTYADAPPDYAFDYDGGAPEAWGSRDGVVRVGERVRGGWRYYYYQPGSDTPYLVRDPDYAYGFEGGQFVVIYDSRGRALPPEYADRQAWLAGRYLARAHDLWRAARERRRMDVEAQVWREQQADQERQRRYWTETRDADPDWRAYHDQHDAEAQNRWAQVAVAWAAAQVASPQQPPEGGEGRRGGGVDEARQVWRARMAQQQGSGPAPQGWNGNGQPHDQGNGQPQQDRWNGQPHDQGNGQPQQERWNGQPHDHGNGQPQQDRWNGQPHDQGNGQPQQDRWNGQPHDHGNGQPQQDRWNGQPHDHGNGQPQQGHWNGRPGEPQPEQQSQGRPGGQGWAGGPSDRQAQQQAEADRQRQFQAQQQAQADRQRQFLAQQQAQADRQRQFLAQQQAQADRQRQFLAQQQAQAERQRQFLAQQQAQAERQRQLQAQQQAHVVQAQQQAQAAHNGKPQNHAPPSGEKSGEKPHWPGQHGPDSQQP